LAATRLVLTYVVDYNSDCNLIIEKSPLHKIFMY